MKLFSVYVDNPTTALGTLVETFVQNAIPITTIAVERENTSFVIKATTTEEIRARETLTTAGYTFKEAHLLVTQLKNTPGTLSQKTQELATQGLNIESIYQLTSDTKTGYKTILLEVSGTGTATTTGTTEKTTTGTPTGTTTRTTTAIPTATTTTTRTTGRTTTTKR